MIMTQQDLLDLFPLPTRRPILTPFNVDFAASTIPTGISVHVVDAPQEMYGKALRIDMAPGLANKRVVLRLKGSMVAGYLPKALPEVEWRIKPDGLADPQSGSAYDKIRILAWMLRGADGYYWSLKNGSGSSPYGLAGPHFGAWDKWRTVRTNPDFQCSRQGSPAGWDYDAPEFEYDSVALSLWNDDDRQRSIYVNSICNIEHQRGAFTLHLDGGYATACDSIFQDWKREGWRGSVSRGAGPTGAPMFPERWPDRRWKEFVEAGWAVGHHIGCQRNGARVELQADVTADELREIFVGSQTELAALGIANDGIHSNAFLRNSRLGQYGGDQAGIMRSVGQWCSRGPVSDALHGFDPNAPQTLYHQYYKPFPGGWPGLHGAFFRYYQDCAYTHPTLGATPQGRDTWEGSETQKLLRRIVEWKSYGMAYPHRIEIDPSEQNSGPSFVAGLYAEAKGYHDAGLLGLISMTDAHFLTYGRPGRIRLIEGDGAYRDVETGRVAI